MASVQEPAVVVKSAYKFYGSKKDKRIVLNHLNMTVDRGSMWVHHNNIIIENILVFLRINAQKTKAKNPGTISLFYFSVANTYLYISSHFM